MDTVRWTCDECDAVNVVVLKDSNATTLFCRECGSDTKLSLAQPVLVIDERPVHHTG